MPKKKILFIDDRPEHLRQPVLRLRMAGYEVDERANGSEGLEALQAGRYHLLILDTQLPTEDGWAVLREVRRDLRLSKTKVIVFMAGKGETGQLELVAVDAELRRPFSLGALLDAVKKVIGEP
jgi:two-component system, NtrC family, response regulator HydG